MSDMLSGFIFLNTGGSVIPGQEIPDEEIPVFSTN
jgi:hypothetical protein